MAVDVARGYAPPDIAARKILSRSTVKDYLVGIYRKAGIGGPNARAALATLVWREAQKDTVLEAELRCDLFDREGGMADCRKSR